MIPYLPDLVPLYECLVPVGTMTASDNGLWWNGVSGWWSTIQALFEGALVGDAYFGCMHRSSHPEYGVWLMYCFQIFTGLLMVNMLIAIMAKTFDTIYEAQEVNYMSLCVRLVWEYKDARAAPPTLNLLSLP